MSHEPPFYTPGLKVETRREPKPRELLFEFYREVDKTRWRCELFDHGREYGGCAEFYCNEEFHLSRTFAPWLDSSRPARALAAQWAEEERKHLEVYP